LRELASTPSSELLVSSGQSSNGYCEKFSSPIHTPLSFPILPFSDNLENRSKPHTYFLFFVLFVSCFSIFSRLLQQSNQHHLPSTTSQHIYTMAASRMVMPKMASLMSSTVTKVARPALRTNIKSNGAQRAFSGTYMALTRNGYRWHERLQ
jgi:hypothetical protein